MDRVLRAAAAGLWFALVRLGVGYGSGDIFAGHFWHGGANKNMAHCALSRTDPQFMPLNEADAQALTKRLLSTHGELIGGLPLARCMGFRTARAFQVAAQRGHLPIETFALPGRRGRFARTFQVAQWLANCDVVPEAQGNERAMRPALPTHSGD